MQPLPITVSCITKMVDLGVPLPRLRDMRELSSKRQRQKVAIIVVCNQLLKQVFGVVKKSMKFQDNYQSYFG